jgi:hypothetical protein
MGPPSMLLQGLPTTADMQAVFQGARHPEAHPCTPTGHSSAAVKATRLRSTVSAPTIQLPLDVANCRPGAINARAAMDEDGLGESPEGPMNTVQALLQFSLASGVVCRVRNGNVVNIQAPMRWSSEAGTALSRLLGSYRLRG